MRKTKFGLLLKFGGSLSLLVIILTILLSLFLTLQEMSRVENDLKDKGESLARNLAHNAEYGLLSANTAELERLLDGVLRESEVIYAGIYDQQGKLIASRKKGDEISKSAYIIELPIESFMLERSPEEVAVSPTSVEKNKQRSETIGQVKLGISMVKVMLTFFQVLRIVTGLSIVMILLGIVGIYVLIEYFLIVPLQKVRLGTKKITDGDLDYKIEIKNQDELGQLADSFNEMTAELKTSTGELKTSREKIAVYVANLEGQVQERTKTLEDNIKELKAAKDDLEKANKKVAGKVGELEQFHDLTVGREMRMIEIEKEIDGLLSELGRPPKYNS